MVSRIRRSLTRSHCRADRSYALWIIGAAIAMPLAGVAQAQQASAPTANDSADTLQEVIVTAERRTTDIQKTPIAITAVSQDELVRAGVQQLQQVQKLAPDVNINAQGSANTVAIRGVYTVDTSPTSESAVGTYVNGGVLAKQRGLEGFLYDVERLEIDKGPQGTLFGRNTNGGAVNIITNKPRLDGKASGEGQLEGGSYNLVRASGWVNAPLSDTVAIRMAMQSYSRDGYMKSGLGDSNLQAARFSLLWKPSDREQFWVVADQSKDHAFLDGGVTNVIGQLSTNAGTPPARVYVPKNPRDDTFYYGVATSNQSPFQEQLVTNGITAQNDYNFDSATWTVLLSHRHMAQDPNIAPNNLTQGPLKVAPDGNSYPGAGRNYTPQFFNSYSVETRLASRESTPLQWVAGLYGFWDHDGGTMIGYGDFTTTTPSVQIAQPFEVVTTAAAFGQVTYTPDALSNLHITAGIRYNKDHKTIRGTFTQFGTGPFAAFIPSAHQSWDKTTYKFGVSYDLSPSSMIFASTSTGYEAGGYGYGPGIDPTVGPVYKPETITAYEIGSKNRFLDNRLQVNVEAWQYHYKDYLANISLSTCPTPTGANPNPTCGGLPALTVESAGEATYRGASIGIDYLITPDNEIRFNATSMFARYGNFVVQAPPGGQYSLQAGVPWNAPVLTQTYQSNSDILSVPKFSGNLGYRHSWRNVWGGELDAQLDAQFRGPTKLFYSPVTNLTPGVTSVTGGGKVTVDAATGITTIEDGTWATLDASVQYKPDGGAWSLTLYGRNLTDGLHPLNFGINGTTKAVTATYLAPRTFGAIIKVQF
jgi:iron complex outermembrane recepter protein